MRSFLLTLTVSIVLSAMLIGTASSTHANALANFKTTSLVASNFKEVIIQVEDSNEKNLAEIRSNIEQAGGMTFRGYCKKLKVLLYVMDTDVHADTYFLNVAFVNVSMGYLLKEGTIAQVQEACGMTSDALPNAEQD